MHYYQFHIGDYRSSTSHLSNEEDLAYRRLLDMYYDTEKPIPTDIEWVARRLRMAPCDIYAVLKDFFKQTKEGWTNETAERNIKSYHEYLTKQSENGKKGGRPKTQPLSTDKPEKSEAKPKKSLTSNHKPITSNQSNTFFDMFWSTYPKKTDKAKAEASFKKINPDQQLLNTMLVGLEAQCRSDQWTREHGKFIPHPSTWLNNRRWEDEVSVPEKKNIFVGAV